MDKIKIAPSILSSDFSKLGKEITAIESAGADLVHIDVMDGHFVDNITIGPAVIKSIRKKTNLPFDIHLMISHPDKYIKEFIEAGGDIITFHYESESEIKNTIKIIKSLGKKVGLALRPKTNWNVIKQYIELLDMVLVMTVEPGFGGQKFITEMIDKIKAVKEYVATIKRPIDIEVDGGINEITVKKAKNCGANIIVAGAYIFNSDNYQERIEKLR